MKKWIHASNEYQYEKNRWYIESDDGAINCCIRVDGYEKPMRGRSAMICLKEENGNVYLLTKPNEDDYGVPGGGWDKGEDPEDAAIRELHEETLCDVKDVERHGTLIEYHEEVKDWVREHVADPDDWWYGYYSAIFVGQYAGEYKGYYIDEEDREYDYKWMKLSEVKDYLPVEYQKAIDEYLENG